MNPERMQAIKYEPNSMSDEFNSWLEDCPVDYYMSSDNGNARSEFVFFDPYKIWEY